MKAQRSKVGLAYGGEEIFPEHGKQIGIVMDAKFGMNVEFDLIWDGVNRTTRRFFLKVYGFCLKLSV